MGQLSQTDQSTLQKGFTQGPPFSWATSLRGAFPRPARLPAAVMVGFSLLGIVLGANVARQPGFTLLAAVIVGGTAVVVSVGNLSSLQRLTAVLFIGGPLLLGYGFANLGLGGALPLPLAEMLLAPLLVAALLASDRKPPWTVLLPMGLWIAVVMARLIWDYPTYGILAVRDTTVAVDALSVFVGYHQLTRWGIPFWRKTLGVIFALVLLYGCTYPWRSALQAVSPSVGLQKSGVPLLGVGSGTTVGVAAAGIFILAYLRTFWRTTLVMALSLVLMAIFQQRGLYVMFPVGLFILMFLLRDRARLGISLAVAAAIGLVVLSSLAVFGLQGRVGPVSLEFLQSNAATLVGRPGAHGATLEGRQEWAQFTLDEINRSAGNMVLGLGLGTNLAPGLVSPRNHEPVRKPHDDYLEVLGRTGLVGLTFFLWFVTATLARIARAARRSLGEERIFLAALLACCVIYLGVAATQPLLSFPYGSVPLFFFFGLGLAAADLGEESNRRLAREDS